MRNSFRFLLLSTVLIANTARPSSAENLIATEVPPALTSDVVTVEIFEKMPDALSWDFSAQRPDESYTEPAFGFAALPTKYSRQGVRADRGLPFFFRASGALRLPRGEHRVLLRARTGCRLWMDQKLILRTSFPNLRSDGHEEVPELPAIIAPDLRYAQPGHMESVTNILSDGETHTFVLEALVGLKGLRPELGELTISIQRDSSPFQLLSPAARVIYSEEGWNDYATRRREYFRLQDKQRRETIAAGESAYWKRRHQRARELIGENGPTVPHTDPSIAVANDVDRFIGAKLQQAHVAPSPLIDDWSFVRRVTLDTIGTIPDLDQIELFRRDKSPNRRAKLIDRLLEHPGWADHWVGYWQDVLAENPGIVKPMLNNTGPFRWWIHESFADNKPMDRFATELIMMQGSAYYGGPAGFAIASENDVPMAQKAQIVAQGFLGMQMQCARCHDAPYHDFKQKDLFSLAAMLKREPQAVPASSSIPTNANIVIGRIVNVTLRPGEKVAPLWPFTEVMSAELSDGVLRDPNDTREKLAALITDPRNSRFARVIVNRLWKRYLGWGIVEPVDDWETARPSHPELLEYLARELAVNNYDLKHVTRLILNSRTYQREAAPDGSREAKPEERLFASPARKRMSAEQITDSLFAAVGKNFDSEEMNMDVDCRRPVKDFNNLGRPARAWEFASLSNERDRPALSMPKAQAIVDCLSTFGWREARQSPLTVREESANVLQPATIANGVLGHGRITRLSDDSAITALCLKKQPLSELIHSIFLRVLSRPPNAEEQKTFVALLEPGFRQRAVEPSASAAFAKPAPRRPVSWSNHLNPEATRIKQELEREVRTGDPPTDRLEPLWRERMEDMLWSLVNSPEFVFIP